MDMKKEVARLNKKVSRWVGEWVQDETNFEMFRDDPPTFFGAYLKGEKKAILLGNRADESITWHYNHYMHGVLNEGRHPWDQFALAARYAKATVQFESAFAEANQGGSVLDDSAVFCFCLNVLAGWRADADTVGRLLVRGLDTHLLDLRHTDRHEAGKVYRHFWFVLHLYCSAKGQTLDTSLYSYPDDMSPYVAVLADWRTPDTDKVQGFVSAMADYHVQETRPTRYEEISEFDGEDVMLFPYEILTFLRLREWVGLPNPETFEHPLMNQPLARMPPPEPLPVPATPLLDQVIEKFKQEYPGSFA